MGTSDRPRTLAEWREWIACAPAGTTLEAAAVLRLLEDLEAAAPVPETAQEGPAEPPSWTWRERLWTAPAETRIGRGELLEALGKPASWLYRLTSPKRAEETGQTIPHRKLDGDLVFVVGEIRAWLREREEVITAGPMESAPGELRIVGGGRP